MDKNLSPYIHTEDVHNFIAPRLVIPFILSLLEVKSVLDVGCGIGTWLKVFEEHGVRDLIGVDGNHVDQKLLKISPDKFRSHDLREHLNLGRKFDLALCLEVVEHLPESSASLVVNTLVDYSDFVLFSAAIPGQGGQHHINEQWLSFWVQQFEKFGYDMHDIVRPKFWKNENVDVWYRQNMVLFCKRGHPIEKHLLSLASTCVDIVHPDLFDFYFRQSERAAMFEDGKIGIKLAFSSLWRAMVHKFK